MSRSSKGLISILLVALMFLAGCGAGGDTDLTKSVKYKTMGKATYAPVEIPYVIDNPLEFMEINESPDKNHRWNYFQISGLLDQTVEEEINESIKSLFEEMLPYATGDKRPPYRGIETLIQGEEKINYSIVSIEPQFNCNNILSVVAYVSAEYPPSKTERHVNFSMNEALNFDLNTGKTFLLPDVFTNDTNGLEFINTAIVKEVKRRNLMIDDYYEYHSFSLVAPFKGIDHKQKFYLSNNGINIIIDYDNPEFDVGFSHNIVTLPFHSPEGHTAITERFYNQDHSIFTREVASKRFLQDYHLDLVRERENYHRNGIEWYVSTSHPANLSQSVIDIFDGLIVDQEEEIILSMQESPVSFVEQNVYAYGTGPYINISTYLHIGRTNDTHFQENNFVYDATGQLIGLEDLFSEGYDYAALIENTMKKRIIDDGLSQNPDMEILLEDLNFKLNDISISFVTRVYQWSPNNKYPLYFEISYEDIGHENLRIFEGK